MSLRLFAVIGLVLALGGAAGAAAPVGNDQAEIAKAEAYLNGIGTLRARFMQVGPDGGTVEGTVYLSRPGHRRLEYDPPSPVLVIADGRFLIYYDKQLKQVSYVGLDSTPAGILVKPQIRLDGDDLKVARVGRQPGVLNITVVNKNDPGQGRITLVFTEQPLQLRQWQVTDPQGQMTTVSLFDAHDGLALNKDLFVFDDPNFSGQPYLRDDNKN